MKPSVWLDPYSNKFVCSAYRPISETQRHLPDGGKSDKRLSSSQHVQHLLRGSPGITYSLEPITEELTHTDFFFEAVFDFVAVRQTHRYRQTQTDTHTHTQAHTRARARTHTHTHA